MRANKRKQPMIMLVDGHCHLCNGITKFVIKRDKAAKFQFASLQSQIGQQLLAEGGLPLHDLDTFVFICSGRYYTKSGAALRVFRQLNGLWPLLYPFIIVPAPFRNAVYDFIASNRYRWFGRSDSCLLPNASLRERFLDE
ncbi:thiol-disulfide oxidoreductase DCC family protein [Paenibacillus harenae]|uniref:thiol-disulfide oxidoreductase DCC family protein n=1 Tax=Paenibacillus harenae TaxID=306543 RepID=UPI00278EC7E7|nr:thiol-disulfide oxidoreductase DCC family protein [Paenibacillus harenae]MDQ0057965.1 putative DCC family thiol-disulfide oxidoreductase YuxK [Paenibacillus harenae]